MDGREAELMGGGDECDVTCRGSACGMWGRGGKIRTAQKWKREWKVEGRMGGARHNDRCVVKGTECEKRREAERRAQGWET
jgi:hypothetical protein